MVAERTGDPQLAVRCANFPIWKCQVSHACRSFFPLTRARGGRAARLGDASTPPNTSKRVKVNLLSTEEDNPAADLEEQRQERGKGRGQAEGDGARRAGQLLR